MRKDIEYLVLLNCILIEEEKISKRLAKKYAEELQSHSETKTWIGYNGIQEGSIVKTIQRILQSMGLFKGGLTGKFGELTHNAIIRFQENSYNENGNKLKVDGRVGKQTRWALENILKSYIPYISEEKVDKEGENKSTKAKKVWPETESNKDGEPKKTIII